MSGKGFASAPTAIKLAKGERRPSRVNYDEPKVEAPDSLAPPEGLTGAGLTEWESQIGLLVDAGILRESDLTAFENYCRALTDLRRMEEKLAESEPELAIAKGYVNATVKLRGQVNTLAQQCGLTPSSRSGVKAAKKDPGKKTAEQRYLSALPGGKAAAAK